MFGQHPLGVRDERVVRDPPVHAQLGGDRGHRPAMITDRLSSLPAGAGGDPGAGGDLLGSASVNTFRSHSGTRQCHFRLCHNNTGRSGPIRTSRGRVTTRSFGDDDCCPHAGHHPASSGSVEQCTTRRPDSSISTRSTTNPSIPNNSELPWSMLVVLRTDCLRTTSLEGHGPSPHPTRRRAIRPPIPTKSEDPS